MRRHQAVRPTPSAPIDVGDVVACCRERVAVSGIGQDLPPDARRLAVAEVVDRCLTDMGITDADDVLRLVVDEIVGFGPLEPLLADASVTEIMVTGPARVSVEVGGRLHHRPEVRFRDAAHLRSVVDRLIGAAGRRIDDGSPMVDARLPDGSRVNAVVPPVAVDGPHLTVRRPPRHLWDFGALVRAGALAGPVAAFLHAAVLGRCNILVVGAAGAGKSTLLAALCDLVPHDQRMVVLEDVAELAVHHPGAARQECRPPAPGGGREVALRDLVRNALRMRPDRLVVGEVRGAEAVDMVTAMSTGHDGSMATMHANTPEDALLRLESMLALGWSAPPATLRSWADTALDVVVQCERRADGLRRVTRVCALDPASDPVSPMAPLFKENASGRVDGCGTVPRRCLEKMARHGAMFPPGLFARVRAA